MKRRQPKAFQIFKQCALNSVVLWFVINVWLEGLRRNKHPPSSGSNVYVQT